MVWSGQMKIPTKSSLIGTERLYLEGRTFESLGEKCNRASFRLKW